MRRASIHIPGPALAAQQRARTTAAARATAAEIATALASLAGLAFLVLCIICCWIAA